jgi:hypothetical protein
LDSNRLSNALTLCLLVIFFLLVLSFIPKFHLGNWTFKKIDPLADVRNKSFQNSTLAEEETQEEFYVPKDTVLQAKIDSAAKVVTSGCPNGITCIEDYSSDSSALSYFIKALRKLKQDKKPLHIAMYGDSFIEGDVLCGSFRDTLQALFGGSGVGYVPITSDVTGFRRSIKHQFENWETFSIIKKDTTKKSTLGPAGFCFLPLADNWVEYKPARQRNIKEFSLVKLYYKSTGHATIDYVVNDTLNFIEDLPSSRKLQEWRYEGSQIRSILFQFPKYDSLELYGASFEDYKGIYVDNFSMRGNSGLALDLIPDDILSSFNKHRNYKLILLQYGLNVSLEDSAKYRWYTDRMITVVKKIKKDFPKASILLLSVSDRSTNTSGEFKTMPTIPTMRNAQRYIAQQTGIAFWDMFEAMGGENSMVEFVESKPSLAAKDYTHLTFKGGKKIARLLVNSLLYEQEQHEKK